MKSFQIAPERACLRFHDIPGDGWPLMFIHGLGCASSCDYPAVASDPILAGRRMLLVDLLGSGFSDRPAGFGYTIDDHARTIVELALGLGLTSFDLFGHSMGGAVAISAAKLLGDRVRHLLLGEPNLMPGGGASSRRIATVSEADFVAKGHAELVEASRAEGNGVWATSLLISAPFAVHRAATSLVAGSDPTWRTQLLGMTMARTVIVGAKTLPHPDAETLPGEGVRVEIVPSAGHSMAWENPSGLAEALRKALERAKG